MRTFNLSEKRIGVFADQIKKNHGEVYLTIQEYFDKFQTFYDLIQEKNQHILFISPEEANPQEIKKQLEQYCLNLDVILNKVVSSDYLVETLKQKTYLPINHFQVFNQKVPETVRQLADQSLNLSQNNIKEVEKQNSQQIQDQINSREENTNSNNNNGRISSDNDSSQDSVDLECLTNISRDILLQRKAQSDKLRLQARKQTRYLWDYNYDSEEEGQDYIDDDGNSQQGENSNRFNNVNNKNNLNDVITINSSIRSQQQDDYLINNDITPIKIESNLFLSKITEKEEQSAFKNTSSTPMKKLKRCVSQSDDDGEQFHIFQTNQNYNKTSSSGYSSREINNRLQIDKNIQYSSNQKSPLKNRSLFLDQQSDSEYTENTDHEFEKLEEEIEFDEDDYLQIDQRFIKEISSNNKSNNILDITPNHQKLFQNNSELKSLKKNNNKIEIILSDDEDDENDKSQDIKIIKQQELDQMKIKQKPGLGSGEDNPFKPFSGQLKRERYWDERKDQFACAKGNPKENYNKLITEELEKLLKIYQQEKDLGRSIAYRKAVSIIKSLNFQITSVKDIQKITGIGEKTKQKIKEILETGQCQRAQILTNNERNQTIDLLSQVWGIGPSTAAILYQKGIKSINELRQNQHLLNKNQKIGLKYFEDLVERMPRDEATQIVEQVKKGFGEIYPNEVDKYHMIACGSYRRGKETCGDVDILICRKDGEENKPKKLMLNLIFKLEQNGLLVEHLQFPRAGQYGSETYMGVGKLEGGKHRRIDLKYYPKDLYGYALLYFTGSDYFNRSMRLFARKKGYSLSDHGMYAVSRINNKIKITSSLAIPCYTEEEVFAALNLEYKSPQQRSI